MPHQLKRAGVNDVFLRIDADREIKVFSNGTVFPEYILGYDLKDCGINEKVKTGVLLGDSGAVR